jgi:Skp family chaperone for outer membrane proteins
VVWVVLASAESREKVASLNVERAVFMTAQFKQEFKDLSRRLEPRQNELRAMSAEIETLKNRLNSHSPAPSDAERATLQSAIDSKQKQLDSALQSAKKDAADQQNEIAQRIINRMANIVVNVAHERKLSAVVDISPTIGQDVQKPWPQGPVFWSASPKAAKSAASEKPEVDITDPVVSKYNSTYPMATDQ